jgi:hypothetical protein
MTQFDENHDSMDSFIHRFEIYASAQGWDSKQWAVFLSALLKGKALDVYSRLPVEDANDYDTLKEALLKRFNLTEEGFKRKFKAAKSEENEAPAQFIARLQSYFMKWIELSGTTKTFKGLCDLMIRDQYIDTCPEDLALFLRERAESDLTCVAKLAEQFTEAHKNVASSRPVEDTRNRQDNRPTKVAAMGNGDNRNTPRKFDDRKCFRCGGRSHIAKNCRTLLPTQVASMQFQGQNRGRGSYNNTKENFYTGPPPAHNTPIMTSPSHFNGYDRDGSETRVKQIDSKVIGETCKAHGLTRCSQCLNIPHECRTTLTAGNMHTSCGCVLPVVVDATCRIDGENRENMPVTMGRIGDQQVEVLRDTGCSTVIVKQSLVRSHQLTGERKHCVLNDGTIREVPVAEIDIDTPYYQGRVTAICMLNPIFDLVIGNIPGVRNTQNKRKKGAT